MRVSSTPKSRLTRIDTSNVLNVSEENGANLRTGPLSSAEGQMFHRFYNFIWSIPNLWRYLPLPSTSHSSPEAVQWQGLSETELFVLSVSNRTVTSEFLRPFARPLLHLTPEIDDTNPRFLHSWTDNMDLNQIGEHFESCFIKCCYSKLLVCLPTAQKSRSNLGVLRRQ